MRMLLLRGTACCWFAPDTYCSRLEPDAERRLLIDGRTASWPSPPSTSSRPLTDQASTDRRLPDRATPRHLERFCFGSTRRTQDALIGLTLDGRPTRLNVCRLRYDKGTLLRSVCKQRRPASPIRPDSTARSIHRPMAPASSPATLLGRRSDPDHLRRAVMLIGLTRFQSRKEHLAGADAVSPFRSFR